MLRSVAAILLISLAVVSVPELLDTHHFVWAIALGGVGFCALAHFVAPHSTPGVLGNVMSGFVAMVLVAGAIDGLFDGSDGS